MFVPCIRHGRPVRTPLGSCPGRIDDCPKHWHCSPSHRPEGNRRGPQPPPNAAGSSGPTLIMAGFDGAARLRRRRPCGKDRPPCGAFLADSLKSRACCRSSVVEHSIGNGEVDSSILSGSTIFQPYPSPMKRFAGASAYAFCANRFSGKSI
jgi:hypothetical protein